MSVMMKNSNKLKKKALQLIPALSQTFSKAPSSYVEGVYPAFLKKGKGSKVFDVDGNKYIDYVLGLGPVLLGYNYDKVNRAIRKQLSNGISFSMPHPLEVETSEKIHSIIPNAEMVKFAKTGSDAGTGAVRVARAITGRNNIAYCGGGGVWHDWFTILTSRNAGIPKNLKQMIKKFTYNDIDSLKKIFENWHGEVAAVYMEPMTLELPTPNFLKQIKKICKSNGALLIFDEVITGFRLSNGGAQKFFDIDSDLAVFGKGMGNGMPIGAITGKSIYMEKFNDVFYSTTFGGETLSLAAASAVIDELEDKPVVNHCWTLGSYFMNEFNKLSCEVDVPITLKGIPVRSSIICADVSGNPSNLIKSLFYQETIKRGILFGPGYIFLSYSHSKSDIQRTLEKCEQSMYVVKKAIKTNTIRSKLKGKPMKTVMTF